MAGRVCYVYFIQRGERGPVKIGFSTNPRSRMEALQTAQAEPLRLIGIMRGDAAIEARLHRHLRESRMNGEWFAPTAEVLIAANSCGSCAFPDIAADTHTSRVQSANAAKDELLGRCCERFKRMRKALGWTQAEAAKRYGVLRATWIGWETGRTAVRADVMHWLENEFASRVQHLAPSVFRYATPPGGVA